jgi:hypothetical protein
MENSTRMAPRTGKRRKKRVRTGDTEVKNRQATNSIDLAAGYPRFVFRPDGNKRILINNDAELNAARTDHVAQELATKGEEDRIFEQAMSGNLEEFSKDAELVDRFFRKHYEAPGKRQPLLIVREYVEKFPHFAIVSAWAGPLIPLIQFVDSSRDVPESPQSKPLLLPALPDARRKAQKPGPKTNMDFHRAVAAIVSPYEPNWRYELMPIAAQLDRSKPTKKYPKKTWAKREPGISSWVQAVKHYPQLVRKKIDHSLKSFAKKSAD